MVSRRRVLQTMLALLAGSPPGRPAAAAAAPVEVTIADGVALQRFDFESAGVDGWTTLGGTWTVEAMDGAPSGRNVLVQRPTGHAFNILLVPSGPFADVDVSVKFKPIAGRHDASGGIVFRFEAGRYYVVRADALHGDVRLYGGDGGRLLAAAPGTPPVFGQWHTLRVLAVGDHVQGWLDGQLLLDHRDAGLKRGRVGLWTEADSTTAFDDLTVRGA